MRPLLPPPLLTALFAGAMYVVARQWDLAAIFFPGRMAAAIALAGAGAAILAASVGAFFKAKTTVNPMAPGKASRLVVSGLYRFSRNPMYLAMLLLLAGWTIYLGEAANLALCAAFVVCMNVLQIRPEEAALEAKFGDEYRAYKQRVRRWI